MKVHLLLIPRHELQVVSGRDVVGPPHFLPHLDAVLYHGRVDERHDGRYGRSQDVLATLDQGLHSADLG